MKPTKGPASKTPHAIVVSDIAQASAPEAKASGTRLQSGSRLHDLSLRDRTPRELAIHAFITAQDRLETALTHSQLDDLAMHFQNRAARARSTTSDTTWLGRAKRAISGWSGSTSLGSDFPRVNESFFADLGALHGAAVVALVDVVRHGGAPMRGASHDVDARWNFCIRQLSETSELCASIASAARELGGFESWLPHLDEIARTPSLDHLEQPANA